MEGGGREVEKSQRRIPSRWKRRIFRVLGIFPSRADGQVRFGDSGCNASRAQDRAARRNPSLIIRVFVPGETCRKHGGDKNRFRRARRGPCRTCSRTDPRRCGDAPTMPWSNGGTQKETQGDREEESEGGNETGGARGARQGGGIPCPGRPRLRPAPRPAPRPGQGGLGGWPVDGLGMAHHRPEARQTANIRTREAVQQPHDRLDGSA